MMIKNDGGWVFPQPIMTLPNGDVYAAGDWHSQNGGMTKREHFSAAILAGLLASPDGYKLDAVEENVARAVVYADALLVELAK